MSLWLTPPSWEGWKAHFEVAGTNFWRRPGRVWRARSRTSAANRPTLEVHRDITTQQCR
jgi:hypothetical protein